MPVSKPVSWLSDHQCSCLRSSVYCLTVFTSLIDAFRYRNAANVKNHGKHPNLPDKPKCTISVNLILSSLSDNGVYVAVIMTVIAGVSK